MIEEQIISDALTLRAQQAALPADLLGRVKERALQPVRPRIQPQRLAAAAALTLALTTGLMVYTPVGQAMADGLKVVWSVMTNSQWAHLKKQPPAPATVLAEGKATKPSVAEARKHFPALFTTVPQGWKQVWEDTGFRLKQSGNTFTIDPSAYILHQMYTNAQGDTLDVTQFLSATMNGELSFAPGTRSINIHGYQGFVEPKTFDITWSGEPSTAPKSSERNEADVVVLVPLANSDQQIIVKIRSQKIDAPLSADELVAFAEAYTAQSPVAAH